MATFPLMALPPELQVMVFERLDTYAGTYSLIDKLFRITLMRL